LTGLWLYRARLQKANAGTTIVVVMDEGAKVQEQEQTCGYEEV